MTVQQSKQTTIQRVTVKLSLLNCRFSSSLVSFDFVLTLFYNRFNAAGTVLDEGTEFESLLISGGYTGKLIDNADVTKTTEIFKSGVMMSG